MARTILRRSAEPAKLQDIVHQSVKKVYCMTHTIFINRCIYLILISTDHWKVHKKACNIDKDFKAPKNERKLFKKFDDECRHGGRSPTDILGFEGRSSFLS